MTRRSRTEQSGRGQERKRGSASIAKSSPDDRNGESESSGASKTSKRDPQAQGEPTAFSGEATVILPPFQALPGLYLVATPIGNLGDITLRALSVLSGVNLIACEDTRISRRLLDRYGIKTKLTAYHDHNAQTVRPRLLDQIAQGQSVALVSDAGMPLVSDPGYKLVRDAVARDILVTVVPGPSSVPSALALSGLPSDRFLFAGFLPARKAARTRVLADLKDIETTLIFFEAARRLPQSIADMAGVLGDRQAAVARELTKKFEQVRRGTLFGLAAAYQEEGAPKGEVVVVIAPPDASMAREVDIDDVLKPLLVRHSLKQAVAMATAKTGRPRREVYARALHLTGKT
ncbi:MAG TPA: 16S rRNA (cytidine(1402)-2'-O)-methyltransferase [Sneathiellales bacterium]|nr:16S rRNA (cytidine(1402)-2'-O)-methyltransferase [Sneathiellales bacterium]